MEKGVGCLAEDYLLTYRWRDEVITNPYEAIAELFRFGDIAFYRKFIRQILLSAGRPKVYNKDDPGNVIYKFQTIQSAINCAYLLTREDKGDLPVDADHLLDRHNYCGRGIRSDQWQCFPRTLTIKEYKNPYLVFRRFFKYQTLHKWKEDLGEILIYALTRDAEGPLIDLLSMYLHLTKLFEAAHLIVVRNGASAE